MLTVEATWVWDFWLADDGDRFHAFFLHAPTSLGSEERRHRAARIGHAVSLDLTEWDVLPERPIDVGSRGDFDETATWTGSIVRGDDGLWRMFYTGSRFLEPEPAVANIEAIGVAVSADLHTWVKRPGPVTSADGRWYETWGTSTWKEEAWRDPWVFRDPSGAGWHMLVTARANHGAVDDRGVLGHAFSADLETWEVRPPLTQPGSGFAHLEVPQVAEIDGRWVLLFSCIGSAMTADYTAAFPDAGTWVVTIDDPTRPIDLSYARPLTAESRYSGRVVQERDGSWEFLAFQNTSAGSPFVGGIADPVAFTLDADGQPVLADSGGHSQPQLQTSRTPQVRTGEQRHAQPAPHVSKDGYKREGES
ncbi:glycosyl hydrolase family 32 [Agromyces sp. ISL-38]|uniref:glycoside hydrolase family 68 protein n=1 Tax=Agromyces sp. ISL-38 TaxID=2819107 RepID=UPI001BEA58A9|nr:glycoside hydrolase family 68 protein [Agromyces sp. ISL-38]MBT2498354.1 glycosyl hydrolase family 32 [Agromyces sp. ISL-38]MBT2519012.1 glycosyl hydrolase family 32 [Streptomyces sp. ISL-90]